MHKRKYKSSRGAFRGIQNQGEMATYFKSAYDLIYEIYELTYLCPYSEPAGRLT